MANKVILSKQGQIKWRDGLRGLIMAIGVPMFYYLIELIPNLNADPIIKIGLSAGAAYITKNFLEPAKVITTYSSNDKAASVAEDVKNG